MDTRGHRAIMLDRPIDLLYDPRQQNYTAAAQVDRTLLDELEIVEQEAMNAPDDNVIS